MKLSPDQQHAVDQVMYFLTDPTECEMAIAGPAGTGKTVLTREILDTAKAQEKLMVLIGGQEKERQVFLTSTTNKAAGVLADATGEDTMTIHSLLGLKVFDNYETGVTVLKKTDRSDHIMNALIIVDEAPMCNQELLDYIRSMTHNCKVLYIGDEYQLAPVFEASCPVFNQVKNLVRLTTIHRQAVGSSIIEYAGQFRNALDTGAFPIIMDWGPDVQHVNGPEFKELVTQQFTNMAGLNSARILAWRNKQVIAYNDFVRKLHVTDEAPYPGERFIANQPVFDRKTIMANTDAVLRVSNVRAAIDDEYGIPGWKINLHRTDGWAVKAFKAENQLDVIKLIEHLKKEAKLDRTLWVKYFKAKEYFADLRPIYANTVNKGQGSTYDVVFIDVSDIARNRKNPEIARLMYTALTRASKCVYMYGNLPERLRV